MAERILPSVQFIAVLHIVSLHLQLFFFYPAALAVTLTALNVCSIHTHADGRSLDIVNTRGPTSPTMKRLHGILTSEKNLYSCTGSLKNYKL